MRLSAAPVIATLAMLVVSGGSARSEPLAAGALGPYNVTILQGGIGMSRALPPSTTLTHGGASWTLSSWVRLADVPEVAATIAVVGDPLSGSTWSLVADAGGVSMRVDATHTLRAPTPLIPG